MNLVPEIRQAFEMANEVNLTPEQIEAMEMQEMFIHDQRNAIKKTLNQGLEEGKLAAKIEMARKLLDVLDDVAISHASGLTVAEVAQLRGS